MGTPTTKGFKQYPATVGGLALSRKRFRKDITVRK